MVRLYRVENRTTHLVDGLSGRWFSDDVQYIKDRYARPDTPWFFVDVPEEIAEAARYENIRGDLYGVEGKDFILPQEWAEQKQPLDEPPESTKTYEPLKITEITSNVAKKGRVLDYDKATGRTLFVKHIDNGYAVLAVRTKYSQYVDRIVPIRPVTLTTSTTYGRV